MFKGKGFTLVELMVTIAIVSIISAIALPNYSSFLAQLRVDNEISELHRLLLTTRNIAINSGQRVTLCPLNENNRCSGEWHKELSVFIDLNNNNTYEQVVGESIIKVKAEISLDDQLIYANKRFKIMYSPSGQLSGLSNGTFKYCPKHYQDKSRGIIIARSGRLYVSNDMNGDGIDENRGYKKITCL